MKALQKGTLAYKEKREREAVKSNPCAARVANNSRKRKSNVQTIGAERYQLLVNLRRLLEV